MRGSGWARITYGAGAVADLHGRRPEQQAAARACVRPERFFFLRWTRERILDRVRMDRVRPRHSKTYQWGTG
jgi:hypothetical protein